MAATTTEATINYRTQQYRQMIAEQGGLMFKASKERAPTDGPLKKYGEAYETFRRKSFGDEQPSSSADLERVKVWSEEYLAALGPEEKAAFDAEREAATKKVLDAFQGKEDAMPTKCKLRDGRGAQCTLDGHGFTLLAQHSAVEDFRDDDAVTEKYHRELVELVKQHTGAEHVFLENHTIRSEPEPSGGRGAGAGAGRQQPVQLAHNDFTAHYKEELLESWKGKSATVTFNSWGIIEAAGLSLEELAGKRLLIVNAWKNIGSEPIKRFPLAVCDKRTVGKANELFNGRIAENSLDISMSLPCDEHEWWFYPEMTREEVLLIKTYDSADRAAMPLHTSFPDGAVDGAERRLSMEARLLLVMPESEIATAADNNPTSTAKL